MWEPFETETEFQSYCVYQVISCINTTHQTHIKTQSEQESREVGFELGNDVNFYDDLLVCDIVDKYSRN